jgi:hypothetical protein
MRAGRYDDAICKSHGREVAGPVTSRARRTPESRVGSFGRSYQYGATRTTSQKTPNVQGNVMAFRVSMFFVQQTAKSGGWSENFWNNHVDLTAAKIAAVALADLLEACHGHTSYISNIRYSEVGAFRRTYTNYVGGTFNPNAGNSIVSDYPTQALLLKMAQNPNYVTQQWLRGIPDAQVSAGGFYVPTGDYVNRSNALFAALQNTSNNWVMRVQDKDIPKKAIFAISQTGVVTIPAHGYSSGDYVRISRVKGYTKANGVWKIELIDESSFQLLFWVAPAVATPMSGNPTSQKQVKKFISPATVAFVRATEHKVGRPFGTLSGRRKVRKS